MLNKREFFGFAAKFLLISTLLAAALGFAASNTSEASSFTAEMTSLALNAAGVRSSVDNNTISTQALDVKIIPLCTGYISTSVLAGFIIAFPSSARKKLYGMLIFIPLIYAGTIARLATSFYIGNAHGTEAFALTHDLLWQFGMMIIVVTLAFLWLHFFVKKESVTKRMAS